MDFMLDWEAEGDRFSFEDSDRFEEDSLCSWISEPESLCNNWRGWRKQNGGPAPQTISPRNSTGSTGAQVSSLVELGSQAVACHIPFEVVEHFYIPIPEQLQLRIAFWSFPENEEDIRLYSCLANGSADEFQKGEHLFKARGVKDALQIGFHLSATVNPPQSLAQAKGSFNVAVVFDRRRITACNCTCNSLASWCAHVVALCLFRIHQAHNVCLRAPVSESLSRLHRDQLQKFAQYLISELPQQILPTAQRLLDELLSSQQTAINTVCGAPDPTAGPSASEQTTWCLDESTLHENIKKTLIKFCVPSPIVFSDVNYLSSTAPPAAAEWQSLLRPLRGREPEGIWNLLSIVREMYKRNDSNAIPLLEILTEEILACEQILLWWFTTKVSASHNSSNHPARGSQNSSSSSQHAASSMCDEIVALWRLAALNPGLSSMQRDDLCQQLKDWHIKTIDKVRKGRAGVSVGLPATNPAIKKADIELFSGYKLGIESCQLDWKDYVIPGITYVERDRPRWKFSFGKSGLDADGKRPNRSSKSTVQQTAGVPRPGLEMAMHARRALSQEHNTSDLDHTSGNMDGACSSSSEGFCENDRLDGLLAAMDSDSDIGEGGDEGTWQPLPLPEGASVSQEPQFHRREVPDPALPGPSGLQCAAGPGVVANGAAIPPEVLALAQAKDEHSESDEYHVYFFDPNAMVDGNGEKKKKADEPNYFAGIRKMDNKQENLFARAEGLHAHGHTREACQLACQLAEEMLANPPNLAMESAPVITKGKKKKAQTSSVSVLSSTTLAKAAFLCQVLLEDAYSHHLAFQVGMFGLEMPRPPAASKAQEVKLAFQESELAILLKRIPLGPKELAVIRDRAEKLRDGKLKSRGDALLPLTLASFTFDALCCPVVSPVNGTTNRPPSRSTQPQPPRLPSDEKLGFEAAVAALGLKANVSEAEHPLLCEGTRRQRGDLAIAMLVQYKDDQVKLGKLMEKLLDKEVHQLYKVPSLSAYLAAGSNSSQAKPQSSQPSAMSHSASMDVQRMTVHQMAASEAEADDAVFMSDKHCASVSRHSGVPTTSSPALPPDESQWQDPPLDETLTAYSHSLDYLDLQKSFSQLTTSGGARPKTSEALLARYSNKDTDSSAVEEDGDNADYKAWEAKFRCTNLRSNKKHSVGMAAVDSSAPETTSSDNSPTLVRRNWGKPTGPGSDSGSSGKSSDSLGSSSSGDKGAAAKARDNESPIGPYANVRYAPHMVAESRSSTPNVKGQRYKGKNRAMPTVPNQPSEASAHFMFELAKTVLTKAGGTSSTSLFTQPATSSNHTGPHRHLHLCAFQIGLYALGLHNCVSPNWLSRTYSSHVSWITGQAMEIGSAAINILIETWEGHLTPPEVASLADRASRGRDPNMVRAAAELALSCLPHAHALNPNEIQRALIQCKEQSREMLERACLAVEGAAKGGGVYPEVLFDVARRWYELYEEAAGRGAAAGGTLTLEVHVASTSQALVPVQGAPALVVDGGNAPMMQLVPVQQLNVPQAAAQVQAAQAMAAAAAAVVPNQQIQGTAVAIPPIPYTIPPPGPSHPQLPHHPYIAPYSYVQAVPPNFSHHYSQPHIPLHTHSMHPSYMASYPYQNQQAFTSLPHLGNLPHNGATLYHANVSHLRPPPPSAVQVAYTGQSAQITAMPSRPSGVVQGKLLVQQVDAQGTPTQTTVVVTTHAAAQPVQAGQQAQAPVAQPADSLPAQNSQQMNYLLSAYRVGMLAMETLARRVHDDRPQTKFARNPPYGEDVKWLLAISMKLGTTYLQQFCAAAVNAVVSPFVLQDIALEAAHYLSRNNPAQVSTQLRSQTLNSLVQKCLQMFIQCAHLRMHHITQAEYDEFVQIMCSARNAFCITPGGMVQFNELLQSLRRTKSCKKELWQRIMNALATGNM